MSLSNPAGSFFFLTMVLAGVLLLPADHISCNSSFPIAVTNETELSVSLAFDGINYLVGIEGDASARDAIGAQLVSQSGDLVGSLISTGHWGGAPGVAFDGTNYLLVWEDCPDNGCNRDLWGVLVNPSGATATPFFIHEGPVHKIGGIACDGTNYLVVYFVEVNASTSDSRVYGRFVSTSGFVSQEINISTGFGDFGHYNTAFDGTNYLIVWVDDDNDTEVKGRFVSQSGTLGNELSINASSYHSDNIVAVVFDGTNYLVVWEDQVGGYPDGEWDIFGQLLDTAGDPVGGVIDISTATGSQHLPCVAASGYGYLVTWTDMRNDANEDFACDDGEATCLDIYGQYLSRSGDLLGPEVPISTDDGNQFISPLAHGQSTYLVIWNDGDHVDGEFGDTRGTIMPDTPLLPVRRARRATSVR
jgi:hypothetical protein